MVICSRRNIKVIYSALILVFSLLLWIPQASAEDPNIGKSTDIISFEDSLGSKEFQIWSAGTGPLNYSLSIDGDDAEYFIIDGTSEDVNGQSVNDDDKKTHMLNINMDYDPRLDITLNARIVITENNDVALVSYITLIARFYADTHEPGSPLIGRSPGYIELAGNVTSKRFRIWNNGTGTMNYTLDIYGDDSDYFSLDTEQGQSEGEHDKQAHTVSVEYDSDFHNDTLYAWIEITDGNDNTSYIDLSATETAATRVLIISIEKGINYENAYETYDFRLNVVTDETVEDVNFTPPSGEEIIYLDDTENEDGSIVYWTCQIESDDIDDLIDYEDGLYTIAVAYDNDDCADTNVNFGIPNKPGTIAWPTQEPVITYPEEDTVSPVRLKWEKCVDPNAGSVRLVLENSEDEDYEEIINSIGKEYSKGTTKSSKINLDAGQWRAILGFGKWYQSKNDDGIPYEVGKCTKGYSYFEIMKWFGTFDEFKNHPFIADCCGTEVTFKLTGGGWGWIKDEDGGFPDIDISGTTKKSVFSVKTKRNAKITVGNIYIDNYETDGDIKAIKAKNVNLEGDITIDGGARSITLNNVTGSIYIGIRDSEDEKTFPCFLKLNKASDLVLDSDTPIRYLRATEWLAGSLDAPWITSMTIKGNFGAKLMLYGDESPKAMTLKKVKIAGAIGGEWDIIEGNCGSITFASSTDSIYQFYGDVGKIRAAGNKKMGLPAILSGEWEFGSVKKIKADSVSQCLITTYGSTSKNIPDIRSMTVKGWLSDSTITSAGNIGSIKAGAIQNCNNLEAAGTIGRLKVRGIRNEAFCYINSMVEANHIGTAVVAYPKYNNYGDDLGLTTNSINKLILKDSSRKTTWLDPNLPIKIDDFKVKPF